MISPIAAQLKDPKFYLENYAKIKGKTPGLIPFILNEAQKDLFNALRKSHRLIALKARQIGFSTAICGYLYHKTITTPGTNTALIGYNADLAAEFLDRIKTFYQTAPEHLRPQIHFNSKFELSFPGINSRIFILSGDNVGRGYTLHNALVSELAMMDKADEKMLAIEAAVPVDGQLIIESTPNGVGNKYHRMWMAEDNGYVKKEYGWWWIYTEEEIELIRKRINDPRKFAQEYELEFLVAGRQVFDPAIVKHMQQFILNVGDAVDNGSDPVTFVRELEDGLRIYREPLPGKVYVMGADVAEGITGGDYSTCIIFERGSGEEVGFYRGHIPPDKFGEKLNIWGRIFNDALAVVEINNHGLTTVTTLRNLMYPQLYFRPTRFDVMGTSYSDRLGWRTTRVTRPLMIDDLKQAVGDTSILFHSKEILDEMLTFIFNDGGDMVCQYGFHDDCIFGAAIAFQGFKILYKGDLSQVDYEKHMPTSTYY